MRGPTDRAADPARRRETLRGRRARRRSETAAHTSRQRLRCCAAYGQARSRKESSSTHRRGWMAALLVRAASDRFPKFVIQGGTFEHELRKAKGTSQLMLL